MMFWISNHLEGDGNTPILIEFPDGTIDAETMGPLIENDNSAERLQYNRDIVREMDSDYTMPIEISKPQSHLIE